MAGAEIEISGDFEKAINEVRKKSKKVAPEVIIETSREYLAEVVKEMPCRTGNLRSSALKVWRHLNMPGAPLTKLKDGEKKATYKTHSDKVKQILLNSNSTYRDETKREEKPAFEYALYAAEWREWNRDKNESKLKYILNSGVLDAQTAKEVKKALTEKNYAGVVAKVLSIFGKNNIGIKNTSGNGYWRPYHRFAKGNSKKMTDKAVIKWQKKQQKIFDEHEGK